MIYTFYPYKKSIYKNETIWGATVPNNLANIYSAKPELNKKLNNFNSYPLPVSIFHRYPTAVGVSELSKSFYSSYLINDISWSNGFTGIDGLLLSCVAKKFNFTAIIVPQKGADFGWRLENGSFIGIN